MIIIHQTAIKVKVYFSNVRKTTLDKRALLKYNCSFKTQQKDKTMIVVAPPRAGGTSFCIKLAEDMAIPFYGEISAAYLENSGIDNLKQRSHEIPNTQPQYKDTLFKDMLNETIAGIFLVNRAGYLYAPKADYILLRDPVNVLMSMADGLEKGYPGMPTLNICQYLSVVFEEMYGLVTYSLAARKSVIWFEEHYNCFTPTLIEYLAESKEQHIRHYVEKLLSRSDIEQKIDALKNNS